jgi:hypothetical protein
LVKVEEEGAADGNGATPNSLLSFVRKFSNQRNRNSLNITYRKLVLGTCIGTGQDSWINSEGLVSGGNLSLCELVVRLDSIRLVKLTIAGGGLAGVSAMMLICGTLS